MEPKKNFYERLRDTYENTKKELCILILFVAIVIDLLPSELFSSQLVINNIQLTLILSLSLIVIGVLFEILSRLKENNKRITTIESSSLLDNIFRLIDNEREIDISFIAISGANGWGGVLSKFLDINDQHSLFHKKQVNIDIAIIDESVLDILENSRDRYESVTMVAKEIEHVKKKIAAQGYQNISINLYRYKFMPNILGFLVNDNYLFSTLGYWEVEDGVANSLVLRGGRRNHIVYDKNDGFGGAFYIVRFKGWFQYIKNRVEKTGS